MAEQNLERRVGYCTNVHPGSDLSEMLASVSEFAPLIRMQLDDTTILPVGLWFSRRALDEAMELDEGELRRRLADVGAEVFTLNGFPYGNFHQKSVKYEVYRPDWSRPERLKYTMDLADLLSGLIAEGRSAGISTLPIGWSDVPHSHQAVAAGFLLDIVDHLASIESKTGHCLHVDLEPEPGCLLQRSDDLVTFFKERLFKGQDETRIRRHLRVCHDVCHAAVMFEPQSEVIANYDAAGIRIGKVQISTALEACGDDESAIHKLRDFIEPRWLHQVSIRSHEGLSFHDDLEQAISSETMQAGDCWRIHFHVPVHNDRIHDLPTTQNELKEAIHLLAGRREITEWEVETYAWSALPEYPQSSELATGIANEIRWTLDQLGANS